MIYSPGPCTLSGKAPAFCSISLTPDTQPPGSDVVSISTSADPDGKYSFQGLAAGTYTLRCNRAYSRLNTYFGRNRRVTSSTIEVEGQTTHDEHSDPDGNPLAVQECLHLLRAANVLRCEAGTWRTTRSDVDAAVAAADVQTMIAQRIGYLPPAERTVLRVASVVANGFTSALLHESDPERLAVGARLLDQPGVLFVSADIHTAGAIDDGRNGGFPEMSLPHLNLPVAAGHACGLTGCGSWSQGPAFGAVGYGMIEVDGSSLTLRTENDAGVSHQLVLR